MRVNIKIEVAFDEDTVVGDKQEMIEYLRDNIRREVMFSNLLDTRDEEDMCAIVDSTTVYVEEVG